MGVGMLAVVGVFALALGLVQCPLNPAENGTSWLGNRAMVRCGE